MTINAQVEQFFKGAVNELTKNKDPVFAYNNKVTLFNASTLLAITAVAFGAMALFSASLISLLMWGVVGGASIMTRKATNDSIGIAAKLLTGTADAAGTAAKWIMNLFSDKKNEAQSNLWKKNLLVFGDIVILKNWIPTTEPQ